jgi:hypothetical protein
MYQYNVGALFEKIAIDVAGPFPRNDQGNRYLLIAMDYFTKWPEACGIPNQEASTVAGALVANCSAASEYPGNYIATRVATLNFVCYRRFYDPWEGARFAPSPCTHNRTNGGTVYQKSRGALAEGRRIQSDGLARHDTPFSTGLSGIHARYHRRHPSKLVIRKRTPTAQRSTVRDTPRRGTANNQAYAKFVDHLRGIHKYARQHLRLASNRMKTRCDKLANCAGYQKDERVRLYRPTHTKEKSFKIQSSWEDPRGYKTTILTCKPVCHKE